MRLRLVAFLIFAIGVLLWVLFWLAAEGTIDLSVCFTPCGFQQRYDLPCPTCGFTTAALEFSELRIWKAFLAQPAATIFYVLLIMFGFLAFLTAIFGIYFSVLEDLAGKIHIKYVVWFFLIVGAFGWAIILARAMAERKTG